ncbi:MAG: FAD-dependent oxidoreductase [Bacilli bacterium]|jgi:thioredoxin reductase (NADPH)
MDQIIFDTIIIGGGPAGLAAAIYSKRSANTVKLLEKGAPGGKLNLYSKLENYPGVTQMTAQDLAYKLYEQVQALGLEVAYGDVISVKKDNNLFVVESDEGSLLARAVIVATGTSEKKLGIPGEEAYIGRGVSYCATCDGAFFKDKDVAVIGQSNKAVEESFFLATLVKHVYIVSRGPRLQANPETLEKLKDYPNIIHVPNAVPYQIVGAETVTGIRLRTDKETLLPVSAVFPFIGSVPNTSFLTFKETLDPSGYLIVNENRETAIPGLFGAGDVIAKTLRQIITAASDGAIAAFSANKFIRKL